MGKFGLVELARVMMKENGMEVETTGPNSPLLWLRNNFSREDMNVLLDLYKPKN